MRRKLLFLLLGVIVATALIQGVGVVSGQGWSWIYAAGAAVATCFIVIALVQDESDVGDDRVNGQGRSAGDV